MGLGAFETEYALLALPVKVVLFTTKDSDVTVYRFEPASSEACRPVVETSTTGTRFVPCVAVAG